MSKSNRKKRGKSSHVSQSSLYMARFLGGMIMLSIIAVVVFAFYKLSVSDEAETPKPPRVAQQAPPQPAPQTATPRQQAKYSFYDELKKRNSEVQAEVEAKSRALDNTTATKGTYYRVQVGAFKEQEQADRLRARLILRDYPVTILRSDNFHLVQVGPYQSREEAQKAEESLKKSGFKVLLKKFESN